MVIKNKRKIRQRKVYPVCLNCCRVALNGSVLHFKCIQEYLLKKGYIVLNNPLQVQEVVL